MEQTTIIIPELFNYVSSLKYNDYIKFKHEVKEQCQVSRTCLSKWFNGTLEPSLSKKQTINEISTNLFNTKVYENVYSCDECTIYKYR